MLKSSVRGLLLLAFLLEGSILSAQESEMIKSQSVSSADHGFSVGSGFGTFQDIQVPADQFSEIRGDGRPLGPENGTHSGLPIIASYFYAPARQMLLPNFGATMMHMATMGSDRETFQASYGRIEMFGGLGYQMNEWFGKPQANADLVVRRSSFRNVSNGHFVDAAMPRFSLAISPTTDWTLSGSLATSLWSRFGYSKGEWFANKELAGGASYMSEMAFDAKYHLSSNAQFFLGMAQEQVHISIPNTTAYNDFGLVLDPDLASAREYQLSTTVFKMGLTKLF